MNSGTDVIAQGSPVARHSQIRCTGTPCCSDVVWGPREGLLQYINLYQMESDGRRRQKENRDEFLAVFNGGLNRWFTSHGLGHHCAGFTCCGPLLWLNTTTRMIKAIILLLLASRPNVPALARWTLVLPGAMLAMLNMVHKGK